MWIRWQGKGLDELAGILKEESENRGSAPWWNSQDSLEIGLFGRLKVGWETCRVRFDMAKYSAACVG